MNKKRQEYPQPKRKEQTIMMINDQNTICYHFVEIRVSVTLIFSAK